MKNIFDYVCDKEKTEAKLISGKDCMAESAQAEFEAVKRQFHKTGLGGSTTISSSPFHHGTG